MRTRKPLSARQQTTLWLVFVPLGVACVLLTVDWIASAALVCGFLCGWIAMYNTIEQAPRKTKADILHAVEKYRTGERLN